MNKIIVVKIGTSLLTTESGQLDIQNLKNLVDQVAKIQRIKKKQSDEYKFIIVTSGSITCGSDLLNIVPKKPTYFETILITINDYLVMKYLKGDINYLTLNNKLVKLIKIPYFTRYYKQNPKNIIDIKIMIKKVVTYLNKIKLNEN